MVLIYPIWSCIMKGIRCKRGGRGVINHLNDALCWLVDKWAGAGKGTAAKFNGRSKKKKNPNHDKHRQWLQFNCLQFHFSSLNVIASLFSLAAADNSINTTCQQIAHRPVVWHSCDTDAQPEARCADSALPLAEPQFHHQHFCTSSSFISGTPDRVWVPCGDVKVMPLRCSLIMG